jgi:hypothetical protein
MSLSKNRKRQKVDEDYDVDGDSIERGIETGSGGSGGGGGGGPTTDNRLSAYNAMGSYRKTFKMRRLIDVSGAGVQGINTFFLPYDDLLWYIQKTVYNKTTSKYVVYPHPHVGLFYANEGGPNIGYRPISSKMNISHFIPLQNELIVSGGTANETTSFNATPYIFVGIDTCGILNLAPLNNGAYQALGNGADVGVYFGPNTLPSIDTADIGMNKEMPQGEKQGVVAQLMGGVVTVRTDGMWSHTKKWPTLKPWFLPCNVKYNPASSNNDDRLMYKLPHVIDSVDAQFANMRDLGGEIRLGNSNHCDTWATTTGADAPAIALELPQIKKADGTWFKFRGNFILETELEVEFITCGEDWASTDIAAYPATRTDPYMLKKMCTNTTVASGRTYVNTNISFQTRIR